ncbi:hypothetical protein K3495_g10667 [Podosphaera aphanis]|nr:hypothetical protein K3495_g10667 [Podosphaera aphanis]
MPVPWHIGQEKNENSASQINTTSFHHISTRNSPYRSGNFPIYKNASIFSSPAPHVNMKGSTTNAAAFNSLTHAPTEDFHISWPPAQLSTKDDSTTALDASKKQLRSDFSATHVSPQYQSLGTVELNKRNKMVDYMDQINHIKYSIQPSLMNTSSCLNSALSHQMFIPATEHLNTAFMASISSPVNSFCPGLSDGEGNVAMEPNAPLLADDQAFAENLFSNDQMNLPFIESQSQFVNTYNELQLTNVPQINNSATFCDPLEKLPSNHSSLYATRSTKRLQEQNSLAAAQHIVPKGGIVNNEVTTKSCFATSLKENPERNLTTIKLGYQRPKHDRIYCKQCIRHPEGFRGEHEFRRHQDREHKLIVRKFICVEPTDGGDHPQPVFPLSDCKGRPRNKLKSSKHGGKGGGDGPPMTELKSWMKEVEEPAESQTDHQEDTLDIEVYSPATRLNSVNSDSTSYMFGTNNYYSKMDGISPAASYEAFLPLETSGAATTAMGMQFNFSSNMGMPPNNYHLQPFSLTADSNAFGS